MQALPNTLGGATFGNPGGTHVTIGADGTITGYYADGRKAYDLVPGANAAITSYQDAAVPQGASLTQGAVTFYEDTTHPNTLNASVAISGGTGNGAIQFTVDSNGTLFTLNALPASTGNLALAPFVGPATPTPGANFASGGFANELPLQYRIDAEDNLYLVGAFSYTGASLAANSTSTIFTLPAAFRPAKGLRFPVYQSSGAAGTYCSGIVQTGGAFIIQNPTLAATGAVFELSVKIPMGNI